MRDHPMDRYENMIHHFRRLRGPHRADLFRYYFLFLNGGVYVDGDFMLYQDFDAFYQEEDFISIQTYHKKVNALFNGFLVVRVGSPIMLEALDRLYHTSPRILRHHYLRVCEDLYEIVRKYIRSQKIKIYKEVMDDHSAYTNDDDGHLLARHYWKQKTIPRL
jgi:hypothetical protein